MAQTSTSTSTTPTAQQIPFMYFKDGRCVVMDADGLQEMPGGWTGLVCDARDIKSLWFLGQEGGERSFNKLMATSVDQSQQEIERRGLIN